MTTNHTPTPWEQDGQKIWHKGHIIAIANGGASYISDERNAAFIVKCVNSHDALIQALTWLIVQPDNVSAEHAFNFAKKALAKAKGEA